MKCVLEDVLEAKDVLEDSTSDYYVYLAHVLDHIWSEGKKSWLTLRLKIAFLLFLRKHTKLIDELFDRLQGFQLICFFLVRRKAMIDIRFGYCF